MDKDKFPNFENLYEKHVQKNYKLFIALAIVFIIFSYLLWDIMLFLLLGITTSILVGFGVTHHFAKHSHGLTLYEQSFIGGLISGTAGFIIGMSARNIFATLEIPIEGPIKKYKKTI